jgi:hypothetical protein
VIDRLTRHRPSHATAIAYLALFVALGGTSWAVATGTIGSREIENNSVRSKDLRNNDVRGKDIRSRTLTGRDVARNRLGGREVKESSLGIVPRAQEALRLTGLTAAQLKIRCPPGTVAKAGACLEAGTSPATFAGASTSCASRNRRLPLHFELVALAEAGGGVSASGEWTSSVFESRSTPGQLDTVVVNTVGNASFARAGGPTARRYRCVATPTN